LVNQNHLSFQKKTTTTNFSLAGNEIREFPVKPPLQIVDTNGAGDSFVGGKTNKNIKQNN